MSTVEREIADKERERAIMAYRLMRKQRLQGKKESVSNEEPEKKSRAVSVDRDSASLNTRLFYFSKVKKRDCCMRDPEHQVSSCFSCYVRGNLLYILTRNTNIQSQRKLNA